MTVQELITELQKLPKQEQEVLVNVNTNTSRYGLAQVTPWQVDQSYGGATIHVSLPDGMYIAARKAKS